MKKEIIQTSDAPAPIGPYNQAIKVDQTLYLSGQVAIDAATGELIEGDVQDEARKVMENLGAVLRAAGMDFKHLVKCSIFLKDMNDFGQVNEIYGSYFEEGMGPARETVQVSVLPKNVRVEISGIAILTD
jgi:2-iminobutanoate/2-iminopropanoate deaminase